MTYQVAPVLIRVNDTISIWLLLGVGTVSYAHRSVTDAPSICTAVGRYPVPPWSNIRAIPIPLSLVVGTLVKLAVKFPTILLWKNTAPLDRLCVTTPVAPVNDTIVWLTVWKLTTPAVNVVSPCILTPLIVGAMVFV